MAQSSYNFLHKGKEEDNTLEYSISTCQDSAQQLYPGQTDVSSAQEDGLWSPCLL